MSVDRHDIQFYGSATMSESDSTSSIGGAVDTATKVTWSDIAEGTVEVVSSDSDDTGGPTLTVYGRTPGGAITSEEEALTGQTPAALATTFNRILRVVATGTIEGDVCVVATTATASGTAQSAGSNYLQLANGAVTSAGCFNGMVLRIMTATAGAYQLREIVDSSDTDTDKVYVAPWDTTPTGTITYEIAKGCILPNGPNQISEVRRVFYDAAANASGGAEKVLYEKIFIRNDNSATDLTNATLAEVTGGAASVMAWAYESATGGSGTTTNRLTVPASGISSWVTDTTETAIGDAGDGIIESGVSQGIWLRLTLAAGASASNTYYELQAEGQTV